MTDLLSPSFFWDFKDYTPTRVAFLQLKGHRRTKTEPMIAAKIHGEVIFPQSFAVGKRTTVNRMAEILNKHLAIKKKGYPAG